MFERFLDHSRAGDKRDSIEALDPWLYAEDESEQRTADVSTQGGDRNLVDNDSRAKPSVVEHAKSPKALATSILRIQRAGYQDAGARILSVRFD